MRNLARREPRTFSALAEQQRPRCGDPLVVIDQQLAVERRRDRPPQLRSEVKQKFRAQVSEDYEPYVAAYAGLDLTQQGTHIAHHPNERKSPLRDFCEQPCWRECGEGIRVVCGLYFKAGSQFGKLLVIQENEDILGVERR